MSLRTSQKYLADLYFQYTFCMAMPGKEAELALTPSRTDSAGRKVPIFAQKSQPGPLPVARNKSLESFTDVSTPLKRPTHVRAPGSSPQMNTLAVTPVHSRANSSGGEAGASTDHVLMKKRLVEQFYNMDARSKTPRAAALFGGPLVDKLGDFSRDSPLSKAPNGLRSAGLGHPPGEGLGSHNVDADTDQIGLKSFDEGLLAPTDGAETLLGLDTRRAEFKLDHVSSVLMQAAASLERDTDFSSPVPSGRAQLRQAEQYLESMQQLVDEIVAELTENIAEAKTTYHEQTQRSMAKVAKLSELLQSLGARVDAAKANMADSRAVLETEIGQKIAVLERVSARFDAYDKANRERRMRYFFVALSMVAISLAVLIALRGFGVFHLGLKGVIF